MDLFHDAQGKPFYSAQEEARIKQNFFELVCVMARLRRSCPWDQEQTPESLRRYILEEAYEVMETIADQNWQGLREELGDFLLQVVFQAEIQAERGQFDIADVVAGIVDKMVRRHPHVFEEQQLTSEEVALNWEAIKRAEKGEPRSLFDGFTKGLPALLESYKIGKKAAKVGFDWPEPEPVLAKIKEEIQEIEEAETSQDPALIQEELGDLLFAVSNLVRKHGFEPEEVLRAANRKFVRRFRTMEDLAQADDVDFAGLDLDIQEAYWTRAKQTEKIGK